MWLFVVDAITYSTFFSFHNDDVIWKTIIEIQVQHLTLQTDYTFTNWWKGLVNPPRALIWN